MAVPLASKIGPYLVYHTKSYHKYEKHLDLDVINAMVSLVFISLVFFQ